MDDKNDASKNAVSAAETAAAQAALEHFEQDGTFDVTIEIPRGCRNKYEVDHHTGRIRLDRTLFTSMGYPADYGFIDDSLGEDGDPLDALLLIDEPVFPGCEVRVRPVALMMMTDEHGPDAKIACVPDDVRYDAIRDVDDISGWKRKEILNFFANYKTLEPGKKVQPGLEWQPLAKARAEVIASFRRVSDPDAKRN